MDTPDFSAAVTLNDILPLLSRSEQVRHFLAAELPEYPLLDMLDLMERADVSGLVGASIHDTIVDAIVNEGKTVWTGTRETEHDIYAFEVCEFGGAFIVRATELDDVGYFVTQADAVAFIRREYGDVLEDE